MTTPVDPIAPLCGNVLLDVRQERGFIVLEFSGGKRVQIYACGKVEADYSADCWLGVERCDCPAPSVPAPDHDYGDGYIPGRYVRHAVRKPSANKETADDCGFIES